MKAKKQTEEELPIDNRPLPGIQTIINDGRLTQIREDGTTVFRIKNTVRVLSIIILTVILILLIIFAATVIVDYQQVFPVVVNGDETAISLCEASDMTLLTTHLYMPVTEALGDLSAYSIPDDIDLRGGGSHNGESYIAYTFFLKNNADHAVSIHEQINIVGSTKNVEDALRVRVYRDGEATTYAKISATGMPEYLTVPFPDGKTVMADSTSLEEGQIIRYTIVVWIEGDDPECVNEIAGGSVRLSTSFSTEN